MVVLFNYHLSGGGEISVSPAAKSAAAEKLGHKQPSRNLHQHRRLRHKTLFLSFTLCSVLFKRSV